MIYSLSSSCDMSCGIPIHCSNPCNELMFWNGRMIVTHLKLALMPLHRDKLYMDVDVGSLITITADFRVRIKCDWTKVQDRLETL